MRVTVRYYGFLQVLAGLTEEVVEVSAPAGGAAGTVADLIERLIKRQPALRGVCPLGAVIDQNMVVFRNRQRVTGDSLVRSPLAEGDVIDLVPPLGGGAS